jgi:hypothetical protein
MAFPDAVTVGAILASALRFDGFECVAYRLAPN